ncbi:MAG: hydantoinase B/oxoprolinase family protein [Alcanivoracaceae bacterium]|nr:hydantoinase B/oxoprolinase family protein [Alcanivoracaceae bacterium]
MAQDISPVRLSIFTHRLSGICDEMGAVLRRSAFSPNIKDRLDFSCAIFDADGQLCAQAAHIPVHLGSMAFAMADVVSACDWQPDTLLVLNDPYLGGTHLPDVTVIAPVFSAAATRPDAFAVTRAHHANIGADTPGSMPVSTRLEEEGIVIPPTWLCRGTQWNLALAGRLTGQASLSRAPLSAPRFADFAAQASAARVGARRMQAMLAEMTPAGMGQALDALNDYGQRLARQALAQIPDGRYAFEDVMDDDGQGHEDLPVCVTVTVAGSDVAVDFAGTSAQVPGNINAPLSVAAAAVYYVFRCLMPADAPACAGLFRPIRLAAPEGSLVNARRPAAVAAGNVETSMRLVDAVLGALAPAIPERIPAASHGSMNNLAMGARGDAGWDYYETAGGGLGAHAHGDGLDGVQAHMTNTLNTPVESLESHYPLRVLRYGIRRGSGGAGRHRGGDGLVRELEVLAPATFTVLTERRRHAPWGLAGGQPGKPGCNLLNGAELPPKYSAELVPGDRLVLETPGGGGFGEMIE